MLTAQVIIAQAAMKFIVLLVAVGVDNLSVHQRFLRLFATVQS